MTSLRGETRSLQQQNSPSQSIMAPKQLKLWELAGDNAEWSFSPFVWRVRFALAYKSLPYEYQAWRFTEKELIKPCTTASVDLQVADRLTRSLAGCMRPHSKHILIRLATAQVPTFDCGDKRMNESLDICKFLDQEFPDTPKLFNTACEAGKLICMCTLCLLGSMCSVCLRVEWCNLLQEMSVCTSFTTGECLLNCLV